MQLPLTLPLWLLASTSIPANVKDFYDAHKGKCDKPLAKGFTNGQSSSKSFLYCGDALHTTGAIFLKGPENDYDNMDIDCDGENRGVGKCKNDPSGQGETAFRDEVQKFSKGALKDLDANKIPYVVFGNEEHTPSFDPRKHGMKPLSIMAVVCGDKLVYGIWGDTNGGTATGEASIALADICFPDEHLNGDKGHDKNDVLYIGFTGNNTGDPFHYDWKASSAVKFMKSLQHVGDALVAKL